MGEHDPTTGSFKPTPAIARDATEADTEATVINEPTNTVSFTRGLGNTGYSVQTVMFDCPACGFDRMVRRTRKGGTDRVSYWCLNPNCVHFVRDSLSHDCPGNYPDRDVDEPAVTE